MKQLFVIALSMSLFCFSCKDQKLIDENEQYQLQIKQLKKEVQTMQDEQQKRQFLIKDLQGIQATIVTNKGDISLMFYPEKAPLHCFTFITRAEAGFYNNTQFHRVIPGFMIQGGDPNTKTDQKNTYGQGGPLVMMPHEFNDVSHKRGVLSTARVSDPSYGAGSQFFIMHEDNLGLDGQYTAFGFVTNGMDVVDKIANAKRDQRDLPLEPVVIKTIKVFRE